MLLPVTSLLSPLQFPHKELDFLCIVKELPRESCLKKGKERFKMKNPTEQTLSFIKIINHLSNG